jgi:hypothetical protein
MIGACLKIVARVTRGVCEKIAQNLKPTYFLSKLLHDIFCTENTTEISSTSVIKKTAQRKQSPKENNRPKKTIAQRKQSPKENNRPKKTIAQRKQSPNMRKFA